MPTSKVSEAVKVPGTVRLTVPSAASLPLIQNLSSAGAARSWGAGVAADVEAARERERAAALERQRAKEAQEARERFVRGDADSNSRVELTPFVDAIREG